MKTFKCVLVLFLFTCFYSYSQNWVYSGNFPDNNFMGYTGGHGVAVDPDGKVWCQFYGPSEIVFDVYQNQYRATRAIYVFNADGTPASFSPIKTITVDGITDTLYNSNRGLRADNNGNILASCFDVLYRINYQTGEGMNKVQPIAGMTLTAAAADDAGNIFIAPVLPGNPIQMFAADFTFLGNAVDASVGFSRSIECSGDGNTLYFPSYFNKTVTVYKRPDHFSPFEFAGTILDGISCESITRNKTTGNLWLSGGSYNDPPTPGSSYSPNIWYEYNLSSNTIINSIQWVFNFPQSPTERPRGIAFSPDNLIAYTTCFGDNYYPIIQKYIFDGSYDIYLINVNTGKLERVTKIVNADEYNPTFSNNGKQVAHDVKGGTSPMGHSIYITDISNGVSTLLTGAEGGNDASWSPNGNYIAFDRSVVGDASIYIVPAGGGTRTLVRANAIDAEWSNNSKRLVFTDFTDYSLRTVDLNGGTETVLGPLGINPSWSPDGKYIAYSDGNSIYTIAVNEFGLPKGSPRQITFDSPDVYNSQPSWSNNSKTIVFHSNRDHGWDFNIWLVSATGGTPSMLTGSLYYGDYDPCYSKNGKYVAYDRFTEATYSVSQSIPKNGELISANDNSTPTVYSLKQNYPNPFNPSTLISYTIPQSGFVTVKVYDILGNEVATLVCEVKLEGTHSIIFNASNLPSGVYIYKLQVGSFVQTKQMLLLK